LSESADSELHLVSLKILLNLSDGIKVGFIHRNHCTLCLYSTFDICRTSLGNLSLQILARMKKL